MTLQLHKAERKKAKLRIGLGGPSGSGKTYSALLLASGMAPWDKIALIDTENGSGELYAHLGPYNVITLKDNFAPERYIEAIKACEQAGMEVIVLDSISHEWEGKGGCLELVEQATQASSSKNSYTAWNKITPRHQKFIDSILQSNAHVITTVRKKQDYDMGKDNTGKVVITKVGMKEITRDGFEYELTVSLNLSQNHLASSSKDRTGLFMDKPEFVISPETGKILLEWANSGSEAIQEVKTPVIAPQKPVEATQSKVEPINQLKIKIRDLVDSINPLITKKEDYEKLIKEKTGFDLVGTNFDMIIKSLERIVENQEKEKEKMINDVSKAFNGEEVK